MIILNTTFLLHASVKHEVIEWIRRAYEKSALHSGANGEPMLTRVLSHSEPDTESYALHISFPDLATAQAWNDGVGNSLRALMAKRWGEKALAFHTYLEVVEL